MALSLSPKGGDLGVSQREGFGAKVRASGFQIGCAIRIDEIRCVRVHACGKPSGNNARIIYGLLT